MNYNLNTDPLVIEILPPDKRKANTINLAQSLLSACQWAHDYLFGAYYDDLKERILFNGTKLVLEYALNKEYHTTFRQPELVSDIYITNLNPVLDGFFVGNTEPYCSSIGVTTSSDWIGSNWTFVYVNHFQINIPTAAFTTEQTIRNFVNRYIPASIKFTIVQI
jgi:hypothetical protein